MISKQTKTKIKIKQTKIKNKSKQTKNQTNNEILDKRF